MIDQTTPMITFIEQQYSMKVLTLRTLADGWKKVYHVQQVEGRDWIVRAYPPPGDEGQPVDVEALASVLGFLEQQAYPAERIIRASDGALATRWQDWQVLITTFLGQALTAWQPAEQTNAPDFTHKADEFSYAPDLLFALSAALGRLHSLHPLATLPQAGMLPSRELQWAGSNLASMAGQVPEAHAVQYQHLVTAVQNTDRLEDLPVTLIHNDCNLSNVVMTPAGEIVLIDWESAGRGPALIDVGILLSNCFSKQKLRIEQAAVNAVVDGYCQYRRLSKAELEHLPDAVRFFRLVLLAGYFPDLVNQKVSDDELLYGATYAQWQAQYEASAEIAALARQRFAGYL